MCYTNNACSISINLDFYNTIHEQMLCSIKLHKKLFIRWLPIWPPVSCCVPAFYSDTLQFSGMHVARIFSWASQIVCRHVSQALFTDNQHPFLLAWLSCCEVGRGCVMYIIGNQISWVPSSCFLSKTTCPLNWKPECNCHINCQRVLTPLHAW